MKKNVLRELLYFTKYFLANIDFARAIFKTVCDVAMDLFQCLPDQTPSSS